MVHESLEVFKYLVHLKKYLTGDLDHFHELCAQAEIKELIALESPQGLNAINATRYPYSFEFMFGTPIISRSTIPHTSVLFSACDILGFLSRNEPYFRSTSKNLYSFFKTALPSIKKEELSVLIKVFRNGLIHSYFPKLGLLISYHTTNPQGKLLFKNARNELTLNVNTLEDLVTYRLSEIINDKNLYINMEKQYKILVKGYKDECYEDIEALKKIL